MPNDVTKLLASRESSMEIGKRWRSNGAELADNFRNRSALSETETKYRSVAIANWILMDTMDFDRAAAELNINEAPFAAGN